MTEEFIRIAELIYKKKMGTISSEEEALLNDLLSKDVNRGKVGVDLLNNKTWKESYGEYAGIQHAAAWKKFERRIKSRRFVLFEKFKGVAAILLLGGVALYFYLQEEIGQTSDIEQYEVVKSLDESQVVLHRFSGERHLLTSQKNQIIEEDSLRGKVLNRKNKLIYQMNSWEREEKWDTLVVPSNCDYQVQLADGTNVWLNACSRLIYPEVFTNGKRVVELEGEGYFEVQRDERHPFVVKLNEAQVKVLGTSFNLKFFDAERISTVTLETGKVEVNMFDQCVVLEPNQQACLDLRNQKLEVKRVNAADYRAWTTGKFVFRREQLEIIMNDLARWYNVSVRYEQEEIKNKLFSGIMDRYENISEALSMLEKTGKIRFDVQGNCIIVKENK